MKLTLERHDMEKIIREHVSKIFPDMPVKHIFGLSYGNLEIHFGNDGVIAPAPDPQEPAPVLEPL